MDIDCFIDFLYRSSTRSKNEHPGISPIASRKDKRFRPNYRELSICSLFTSPPMDRHSYTYNVCTYTSIWTILSRLRSLCAWRALTLPLLSSPWTTRSPWPKQAEYSSTSSSQSSSTHRFPGRAVEYNETRLVSCNFLGGRHTFGGLFLPCGLLHHLRWVAFVTLELEIPKSDGILKNYGYKEAFLRLIDCLFHSISILVNNRASLYNKTWVKKAHSNVKISSLEGCPLDFGSDKSRDISVKLNHMEGQV